jgi:hypothetical protein
MLRDGGKRHREGRRDIRHRHVILEQHRKDLTPGRIGEGGEDAIERVIHGPTLAPGRETFNRAVEDAGAPRDPPPGRSAPEHVIFTET